MISTQIREGLQYIGAADRERRAFENASFTSGGVMYDTWLLDAGNRSILIGTMPERYTENWIEQLKRAARQRPIGWIAVFGLEEDRNAVRRVLSEWQDACIIAGTAAMYRLDGMVPESAARIEIRTNRTLMLGNRRLQAVIMEDIAGHPSLNLYDESSRCLFSSDLLNSWYAPEEVLAGRIGEKDAYAEGLREYYLGRRRSASDGFLQRAQKLLEATGTEMVCPVRGPAADEDPVGILQKLRETVAAAEAQKEKKTLAIVYESAGGLREIAGKIAAGAGEAGRIDVRLYDLGNVDREEALRGAEACDAVLLGTTQTGDDAARPIWDIVTTLDRKALEGKLAAVIVQGQPDGSAALQLRVRLGSLGCDISWRDYRVVGKPDETTLEYAYDYGYGFGCRLLNIPNPRKPTLVKCLVCGEIFDASLGVCPVCGVGLDQCVPVDADESTFRRDTDRQYVVLGGGIAGVSAAEAIRLRDDTGRIDLYTAEEELPINRPMLTKDVDAAAAAEESIFLHDGSWYDGRRITLHMGCPVTHIDTERKVVETAKGQEVRYDRLIYAMGAECFIPPFAGWDKPGVFTIRHLSDCALLVRKMKTARRAVVIGGGVLGLEAASEIMRSGIGVTVLEASPQIVGRQVDAQTAAILKKRMERMRIVCLEGVTIAGVEGEKDAEGVRLADGSWFPADFVVVSCGNRGNIAAAKEAGIHTERSIVVNARMETSAPDVYACGDCAQMDGLNYQLWAEASEQGRVAGANAAGEEMFYAHSLLGLSLEGFGTSLFAIGDPGKKEGVPYRTVEIRDEVRGSCEKYWFYGNLLEGAVLIDAPEKIVQVTQDVREHAQYGDLFLSR